MQGWREHITNISLQVLGIGILFLGTFSVSDARGEVCGERLRINTDGEIEVSLRMYGDECDDMHDSVRKQHIAETYINGTLVPYLGTIEVDEVPTTVSFATEANYPTINTTPGFLFWYGPNDEYIMDNRHGHLFVRDGALFIAEPGHYTYFSNVSGDWPESDVGFHQQYATIFTIDDGSDSWGPLPELVPYTDPCGYIDSGPSRFYFDCDDPFGADESFPFDPIEFLVAGQEVSQDTPILVASTTESVSVSVSATDQDFAEQGYVGRIYQEVGGDLLLREDFAMHTQSAPESKVEFELPVTIGDRFHSSLEHMVGTTQPLQHFSFEIVGESSESEEVGDAGSNVLFLPGIMGSRLYEYSDACASEEGEQQRWFSRSDCDQLRLMTDFMGRSEHEIYTRAHEDAIVDSTFVILNLYRSFLQDLADWQAAGDIIDYRAVPYDWRLRLTDIVKTKRVGDEVVYDVSAEYQDSYLYETLAELVDSSATGKVTIVAHSNGGLLTKVFLHALEQHGDPLVDKIDNIVLVGVPQVGTPGALVGLLHGNSIGPWGSVVSQEMSRQLLNTMPFAHHLLPQSEYFAAEGGLVDTPVVEFLPGPATDAWRSTYGATLDTSERMHNFLSKSSGRLAPASDDLGTPAVVDESLLSYANIVSTILAQWSPRPGTEVHQVVGTGLETPAGLTYFSDEECVARNPLRLFVCTEYAPKLSYRVEHTADGDATVVAPSAGVMAENSQVERWWLDLAGYNESLISLFGTGDRTHADMLEVPELITFVADILSGVNTDYEYITPKKPTTEVDERLIFQLHSPLDMWVVSPSGQRVSSSTQDIATGVYRRYGELQYISVPRDSGITLELHGESEGSFTLEVESRSGLQLESRERFVAIPSSSSTRVSVVIDEVVGDSELKIDYHGNGTVDGVYNTYSELMTEENDGAEVVDTTASRSGQILTGSARTLAEAEVAGVVTESVDNASYQEIAELLEKLSLLLDKIEKEYIVYDV